MGKRHGLAKNMIDYAEVIAKENTSFCIQLDIRETQQAAIQLFKSKGYYNGENLTMLLLREKQLRFIFL